MLKGLFKHPEPGQPQMQGYAGAFALSVPPLSAGLYSRTKPQGAPVDPRGIETGKRTPQMFILPNGILQQVGPQGAHPCAHGRTAACLSLLRVQLPFQAGP